MADLAEVLKSALDLEVEDRAALAERLLSSLEELSPDEADRVWAIEAERRLESMASWHEPLGYRLPLFHLQFMLPLAARSERERDHL